MEKIEFQATVARVQTMADGGLRFILDAPETAVMQAAQLMECKRFGAVLRVEIEPDKQVGTDGEKGTVSTRPKRKSKWETT